MKRWYWAAVALLAGIAVIGWLGYPLLASVKAPIRVGILHSLTGTLALTELSMRDGEVLALEQLNASGGLLGRKLEWVVADGRSEPETFAREARRLIEDEKVGVIFGCWSSANRKSVKPVVERAEHLLIYPAAYEGLEQSPNIIYTGAAPNQQIIPTVKWSFDVLQAKRYFLIGSDSVWPRAANTIIKDQLKALGATLAGEEYFSPGTTNVAGAGKKIVAAAPDVILSTVEGDTNLPFYKEIREAGIIPSKIPVITFSLAEDEFRSLSSAQLAGDYAVCNYFQAIDRPVNRQFVSDFKARYRPVDGKDRVTSDAIATAYTSVKLWAQAVREAEIADPKPLQNHILGQSQNAPEGIVTIDRETRHTWRPFFAGRIRSDGQVDIVWTVDKPIRPVPFPFSRPRHDWETFLQELQSSWNVKWEAPPPAPTRVARPAA